jgi:hypothetical protein
MKKFIIIFITLFPILSHAQLENLLTDFKKISQTLQSTVSPVVPPPLPAATVATPSSPTIATPTQPSTAVATSAQPTVNAPPLSVVEPLNLKGFNLRMSKEDVKKIIPNIESVDYFTVDGKMRTTLSCGALFSKSKSNCSFTYAGMELNGIVAAFWGNDLMVFKLIYNTGTRAQVDYNNFKLGSIMKKALVSKYGQQNNTSSSYSGRWIFGDEKMFLELEENASGLFGSVAVSNSTLVTKYQTLLDKQNEDASKKSDAAAKSKTLSDM